MDLVAEGIWRIPAPIPYPMKYVNLYLLEGDGLVLVDSALDLPDARRAIERGLAERGARPGDLDAVVLTHHHPDHYGLAGWFEEMGVPVYMLDVAIQRDHAWWSRFEPWLEQSTAHFREHGMPEAFIADLREVMEATRQRIRPPRAPLPLTSGQTIALAGQRYTVHWTPGHADGHLVLLREDGVLVAGDAILDRITPNVGKWVGSRPDPLGDFLNSLERLRGLEPKRALVGHYGPAIEDVPARITEIEQHHQERLQALERALSTGPRTAWELSLVLFPQEGLSTAQRRFAWAETLAHLVHMEGLGRVRRVPQTPARYELIP
ncbi:MBL fold metallo-hydrolase [Oceanithermus sp.]